MMRRQRERFRVMQAMVALALLTFGLALPVASAPVAAATASLTLSRGLAAPGDTVRVNGTGFQPGDTATVTVVRAQPGASSASSPVATANATVDSSGAFTATFKVPNGTTPGGYTVSAKDGHGNSAFQSLQVIPLIRLKSGAFGPHVYFPAGQKFYVTGSGFTSGEAITLKAAFPLYGSGTQTETNNTTADNSGSFGEVPMQIPWRAQNGDVSLTATGQQSGKNGVASAKITVIHRPVLSLISSTVVPGRSVSVRGTGFVPGEQITVSVTISRNGTFVTVSRNVTAGPHGDFQTSLFLPGNTRPGTYTLTATGLVGHFHASIRLNVARNSNPGSGTTKASLTVAPISVLPGASALVKGIGFVPNTSVTVRVSVQLTSGTPQVLRVTATADQHGSFTATLSVPGAAAGGKYTVAARGAGRAATATLTVAVLKPSVIVVPTLAVPGTAITVNGFGFASKTTVTIYLAGQTLGTATTNGTGTFKVTLTVPSSMATGLYTLTAQESSGRKASIGLRIFRHISTHFYFAALNTWSGYHEYLLLVNTTEIRARVLITYERAAGSPSSKTITVNAHSRFTEDVNQDLGPNVAASAVIATDVPIAAERMVFWATDAALDPGTTSPSTTWYFANGNTTHHYVEYIALQNPNNGPVQVALHLQPTHSRPFTIYRTMRPQSRTTVWINNHVHDAVGVVVTANGPVVANRTTIIHRGISSKTGVKGPASHWYFAAGQRSENAGYWNRNWIGVINTSGRSSYLSLHAYGPAGDELGTVTKWIRPYAREGYLMNTVAGRRDVAVVVTTTQPSIAEQSTFLNYVHDQDTDSFGVTAPQKTVQFAEATTWRGQDNLLALFNPNLAPIPVVVQFLNARGYRTEQTYVIAPLAHEQIDVGSVMPNAQLGLLAASNDPFVALDRQVVNNGAGAMTSIGTQS